MPPCYVGNFVNNKFHFNNLIEIEHIEHIAGDMSSYIHFVIASRPFTHPM